VSGSRARSPPRPFQRYSAALASARPGRRQPLNTGKATSMTEQLDDDSETAVKSGWAMNPAGRYRCLAYLDGPLARGTAVAGWRTDDDIPEHLTVIVGARHHPNYRVETAPGVWLDTYTPRDWGDGPVPGTGRPVRYELDADGYRFAGEGTWPEHETTEEEEDPR
jgi:hypothetical protein